MKPTEWLSQRVPSLNEIRAERLTRPEDVSQDRHQARMLWLHRRENNVRIAVPALAFVVAISVVGGAVYDYFSGPNPNADSSGAILTITAVLASMTGLLLIAIIFGMEFHANRLGNAHFLVRYLGRGAGVVPIVTLSLSVVAANVLVGAISTLSLSRASQVMAIWDIVLVPIVFWFTFHLFYFMVIGISGNFFRDTLLPALSNEYARRLDRQAHYSLMSQEFEKIVEDCGAEVSRYYAFIPPDQDKGIGYRMPGKGLLADVNLSLLSKLVTQIRDEAPECRIVLAIAPGLSVDNGPALWITTDPKDFADALSREERSLPSDITTPVESYLPRIFKLRRPEVSDLLEVLEQFQEVLIHQSGHETPAQFERCLKVYEELFFLNLAHPKRAELHNASCFLYGIKDISAFFDMARKIVESDDEDKVTTLTSFAFTLMAKAIEHREASLIEHAGKIIEAVYWRGIRQPELADTVFERVDGLIGSVTTRFETFRMFHDTRKELPDELQEIRAVLGWILRLVKVAVDADRKEDAVKFLDRIAPDHARVYVGPLSNDIAARVQNAQTYALILAAAWAIRQLSASQSKETCISVIQRIVKKTNGCSRLLHSWWDQDEPGEGAGIVSAFLWPANEVRHRVGISNGSCLDTEWVFRGFVALLLANSKRPWHPSEQLTANSFKSNIPEDHAVLAACNAALEDPVFFEQILDIPEDQSDKRARIVRNLFSQLRKVTKLAKLREIVAADISREHVEALRISTQDSLETYRIWVQVFRQLGGLERQATEELHAAVILKATLGKETVIPESNLCHGGSLSDYLGHKESRVIVAKLLALAPEAGTISDLRKMPDELRRIITELRAGDYVPNMIILPQPNRFSNVLFGIPPWQISNSRTLFGPHIAPWEGCEVFKYPFRFNNPDGILVLDTCRLLGVTENGLVPTVNLEIINDNAVEHQRVLRDAEALPDDSEFPSTSKLTVITALTLLPSLGIRDAKAIAKLSLDLKGVGFALDNDENLFHRPTCPDIADKKVTHSLDPDIDNNHELRKPCAICKPQDWATDVLQ